MKLDKEAQVDAPKFAFRSNRYLGKIENQP